MHTVVAPARTQGRFHSARIVAAALLLGLGSALVAAVQPRHRAVESAPRTAPAEPALAPVTPLPVAAAAPVETAAPALGATA